MSDNATKDLAKICKDEGWACWQKGDYANSFVWYKKAADLGDAGGMYSVGFFYSSGKGVAQNYDEAYKWYYKAANCGYATAMLCLGQYYENGYYVAKDIAQAKIWYKKAADNGNEKAKKALERLNKHVTPAPAKTAASQPPKQSTTSATTAAKTVVTASGKKHFPELTAFLNHLRSLQPSVMNNIYGLGSREDVKLLTQYGDGIKGAFKRYSTGNEREDVTPQFFAALVQYTLRNIDPSRYDERGNLKDSSRFYLFDCRATSGDYKVEAGDQHQAKLNEWGEREGVYTIDDPKWFTVELSFNGTFQNYVYASDNLNTGEFKRFEDKWGGITWLSEGHREQRSSEYFAARSSDRYVKYTNTKDAVKAVVKKIITYLWDNLNVVSPVRFPVEQLGRNKYRFETEYRRIRQAKWTYSFPPSE